MAKRTRLFVLVLAPIALLALAFLGIRLIAGDSALPDLLRAGGIPEPVEAVEPACQEADGPGTEGPAPVTRQLAKQEDPAPARAPSGPEDPLLEVEVYYLENGHEQRAAGARVTVASSAIGESLDPGSSEGTLHSSLDGGPPPPPEREFTCDAGGRVFLPLGAMAGRVRGQWTTFGIWADWRNQDYASERTRVRLDWRGRFQRIVPNPFLDRIKCLRIELHPNQSVTVFVHDESGRGVEGVLVQLFNPKFGLRTMGSVKSVGPCPFLFPEPTGPDGRRRFRFTLTEHFKLVKYNCFAGFAFPLDDHSRWFRKVTEEHYAGKEVDLRMPPTGSVEVEIDGGPEREWRSKRFWVGIEHAGAEFHTRKTTYVAGATLNPIDSRRLFLSQLKIANGYKAVFDFVDLGLQLEVIGVMEGTWRLATKLVLGPTCPGEKVRVLLGPPASDPLVTGIVLDTDGRPLAARSLLVFGGHGLLSNPGQGRLFGREATDATGRFWVALPPPFAKGDWKQLRLVPVEHELEEWPPACVIDLPPAFSEGAHFLGEHKLERPPLLAQGIVVDSDGRPVVGADVHCTVRYSPDRDDWLPHRRTITDHQGHWSIRGLPPQGDFKVQAMVGEAEASKMLLAIPGAQGLRLILERTGVGSIEGRLLVDDPLHLERGMIRIQLIPRVLLNEGMRRHLSRTISKDGSVHWTNVPAGLYELRASVIGDPAEPLALVTGLRVEAGQVNDELVLKPIDLRGRTEEVRLIAKLPSGEAIPARRLWVKDAPGSWIDPDGSGVLFLKRTGEAPVVEVVPLEEPGFYYLPARVRCTGTEVEVVLQPKPAGPNAGGGDGK